jgi:hypothetical protein
MIPMIGLLILAVLVAGCAPAFLADRPGPNGWRLITRPIRRILVSIDRIDRIDAARRRQQDLYESFSRLNGRRPSRPGDRWI